MREFDLWYVGPDQTTPQIQIEKEGGEFWTRGRDLPEHPDGGWRQRPQHRLQRPSRQRCGLPRSGPRRRTSRACPSCGASSSRARGSFRARPRRLRFQREEDFWPGALKSPMAGRLYGIPPTTRRWRSSGTRRCSKRPGLDPDTPPATWDEVVEFSQGHQGGHRQAGYGFDGPRERGNTPFRFMPMLWAYGSGRWSRG